MNLENIRKRIDILDIRIWGLLNERMEQALMARRYKNQVADLKRERRILDRIGECAPGLASETFLRRIYGEILEESKRLQGQDKRLIAFQGEHGAFGEIAALKWNKDLIPVPCGEFAEVFEGVGSGLYDLGIVPVENSLGGVVGQVNELVITTDLHVVGAVRLPVHLCLLAAPGTDHRDIRTVHSHPQALAQCRRFLSRNRLDPVPWHDTAGAARMISENRPGHSAAVASRLAARLYDLETLKEGIEDSPDNRTRFLVLSKEPGRGGGEKCSILFSTEHKAGTLFRVLEVFAARGINLTRIESVPEGGGSYAFLLDFIGSDSDGNVMDALQKVREITTRLRMLGCYVEKEAR
ncbi:MAG: bifunctional chorismate mutase/prephenate dehydratase [Thermodesulfobacteriota bacterium]